MAIPEISISGFDYHLPDDRIARHPAERREDSKLLVYRDGFISESRFRDIVSLLPSDHIMVLNETKVINARLQFRKNTGATIEVFCLEPSNGGHYMEAMQSKAPVRWKCLIGNSKRWKGGNLVMEINGIEPGINLYAERIETVENTHVVEFTWDQADISFHDVLQMAGTTPLPPYLHRGAEPEDTERYQTVYAVNEGSVAAPTAGLHFTKALLNDLETKGIVIERLTLHVGAGTFIPVSEENISKHSMHAEYFMIRKEFLETLLARHENGVIAVGTTTVRALESIYLLGAALLRGEKFEGIPRVHQWDGFIKENEMIDPEESLKALLRYMESAGSGIMPAITSLMIAPGYRYRIPTVMITNFHQPKSTLLLLVAAFIGGDWKKAYTYALERNFRFLSYGDACLFFKKPGISTGRD